MGVYIRRDSPYFWIRLDGVNRRERTKIRIDAPTATQRKENRRLAEEWYHRRMTEVARGLVDPDRTSAIRFAEFVAWFQTHLLPRRRGREREAQMLAKLVAFFGPRDLATITRATAHEYATWRLATPTVIPHKKHTKARIVKAGASTVNREIDLLKAILKAAVPEYLKASPLYGMPRLHAVTPKRRLLSDDEERRLLTALSPIDRALFLLAHDSLVRMGDVLDVRRADDAGDRIWIRDPKAGGGFSVPVSARTRKALDAIPDDGTGYYFSTRRRGETQHARGSAVRQALKRACAKCAPKIPYGRAAEGLTFHWATRRTGATRMLTRGVDVGTVQKVGRWKTPGIVLGIYHELLDEKAFAAVNAVAKRPRSQARRRA